MMDDYTFVLPLKREDLLSSDSSSQYVVQELCDVRDISRKLGDCRTASRSGCTFILEHFDSLFSVFYHVNDLDAKYVLAAYNCISKGMENLRESLPLMIEEDSDPDSRKRLLNMTKMYLFLFSEALRSLEEKFNKNTQKELAVDAKSRKKAAKAFTDFDWDELRGGALIHLYNLVLLPLQKLWDPPVADEDFVTLAANCCYKVLEDPQISQVRFKNVRETINHILGTLVQRYNHGLSCSVKMVQLLKLYEHLAVPLAEAAITLVRDYSSRNFIREIIRELSEAEMAFDVNAPKACSQFLLETAQIAPDLLLQSMPLLVPHLESDSYMMRNCVLGVICEIISNSLCEEQLTDEQKETRDIFFEHLEDHLNDLNAYVRCKVLKIWQRLCQEKAIPLSRWSQLLGQIIPRLKDVSWSVTRQAVQLYCSLLQSNPFGDKIVLEELQTRLHNEEVILAGLEKNLIRIIPPSRAKQWKEISPVIIVTIQNILAGRDDVDLEEEVQESLASNIKIIARFLDSGDYAKAFKLLKLTESVYPQSDELKANRVMEWQVDYYLKLLQKIFIEFDESQEGGTRKESELTNEQKEAQEQVLKQRSFTQYLLDCVTFAKHLEEATEVINNLLQCAQPAVIQDALEYLTAAFQFGLKGAMDGVRNMLLLVWSSESSVKEAVAIAYKTLYLEISANAPGRSRADEIVRNLCTLLQTLDEAQQSALEVLVKQWVRNDEMDKECIQIMWERFCMKLPGTTEEESRNSLILLTMVGGAEPNIIKRNIEVLVSIGLVERGSKDFRLAKETCRALLRLVPETVSVASNEEQIRFKSDHMLIESLCSILKEGFLNLDEQYYIPFADEAIDAIYQLSEHPNETCAKLLCHFGKLVKNHPSTSSFDELLGNRSSNEKETRVQSSSAEEKINVECLNRFVFLIGHIAFRQWAHLDKAVFRELKRRNRIREERDEKRRGDQERKKSKDKRKSLASLNSSILSRASETPLRKDKEGAESPRKKDKDKDKDDSADAEIGELNADDAEAEYINQVCEDELSFDKSLLARLAPIVVTVCTNPQKYPDIKLKSTASIALTKLMLVSSKVCEESLPLVFTMLEKCNEPVVRSTLVSAIGDLVNRFPNLLEPWVKHLYARLHDLSSRVRLDTIVVLKYLITNEMVKVRAQIYEMAVCIVDPEEKIAVMASQFFQDLSKKGNTLYNVLPEIISRLSDPSTNISEDHFHTILEFLIPLIQKDKQMESLVEKLCQRFKLYTRERQWRDIAFCLSLLQYSERSLQRLVENFTCCEDSLNSNEVRETFDSIISQALKSNKPEKKAIAEELRTKIDDHLKKGTGENGGENNAEARESDEDEGRRDQGKRRYKNANKKNQRRESQRGKQRGNSHLATRRRRHQTSSEDEESEEDVPRHSARAKRRSKKN